MHSRCSFNPAISNKKKKRTTIIGLFVTHSIIHRKKSLLFEKKQFCSLQTSNYPWPKGMAERCNRGGSVWVLGKGSALRVWSGTGTSSPWQWAWHGACQSSGSVLAMLRHLVLFLGGPVWRRELDFTILAGPFLLRIFYDSN